MTPAVTATLAAVGIVVALAGILKAVGEVLLSGSAPRRPGECPTCGDVHERWEPLEHGKMRRTESRACPVRLAEILRRRRIYLIELERRRLLDAEPPDALRRLRVDGPVLASRGDE